MTAPLTPDSGEESLKNKTIGQVLKALETDFEGISASKIRFLEDRGLIHPQRTKTGYRKYSQQDVDRLRYILTLQRDHYLPLKVIGQRLEAGGSLEELQQQPQETPRPQPAKTASVALGPQETAASFSLRELGQEAGVDMPLLRELMNYGLLAENKETYDHYDLAVTRVSNQLTAHGLHPRHLRAFRAAADREVDLVETAVGPLALRKDAQSQQRAAELAAEIAQLLLRLHMALVAGSMPSFGAEEKQD